LTELVLAGGRVIDPANGLDEVAAVAVAGGLIESVGPAVESGSVINAGGLLVVPGLVDLHTHVYRGVSHYGVDADHHCLRRGVTTAVDAGSAGAQTFPGLREYVIERSRTRILAFLHIAVEGMISALVGELEDLRWASPDETVARARNDLSLEVDRGAGHVDDECLRGRCLAVDLERPVGGDTRDGRRERIRR